MIQINKLICIILIKNFTGVFHKGVYNYMLIIRLFFAIFSQMESEKRTLIRNIENPGRLNNSASRSRYFYDLKIFSRSLDRKSRRTR